MAKEGNPIGGSLIAAASAIAPWFAAISAAIASIKALWQSVKHAHPNAVMDTTTGNVYESMAAATAAGIDPANLTLTVDDATLVQTLLTNGGLLKAESAEAKAWAQALPR